MSVAPEPSNVTARYQVQARDLEGMAAIAQPIVRELTDAVESGATETDCRTLATYAR